MKFTKSERLYRESCSILPAGVGSNARLWKANRTSHTPQTIFIKKAVGSKIWDVDGNKFIDYRLGYGPVILGHSYPKVHAAVHRADEKGLVYAFDNELELRVAKKIRQFVPSMQMLRFANSGTEATMAAIRVARASTKRDKVIKFEGHYHGWHDAVAFSTRPGYVCAKRAIPASLGVPKSMYRYTAVCCSWNDPADLERVVKNHPDAACIITEPVMGNAGSIPPQDDFLRHMREICDRHDILLIFDEVKTGFRLAKGGAQQVYKVKPDLSTFAKSLGNGYPIATFGGRKDLMSLIGPGKVMHGGTYSANPVSLAAAHATLMELQRSAVWTHLYRFGRKLMRGIDEALEPFPHVVHGHPTMFQYLFTDRNEIRDYRDLAFCDMKKYAAFQFELLKRGVMVDEDGEEALYTSYSHSMADLQKTLAAFEAATRVIKKTHHKKHVSNIMPHMSISAGAK